MTPSIGPVEKAFRAKIAEGKKLFFILLDPDAERPEATVKSGVTAAAAGADAILIGGSFVANPAFSRTATALREATQVPVILFPGGASQVVPGPDAILFTSLLSGRNAQYLIDEQVRGAQLVKAYKIEPLPTAYLLIESGKTTAVEYISQTRPIPADKPAIAAAHALAAEMLGMRWVYLEAGSGAERPVPTAMISAVRKTCDIFVIAGGGIRDPETARAMVAAGAHAVVIGNVFETTKDASLFQRMSEAIHGG